MHYSAVNWVCEDEALLVYAKALDNDNNQDVGQSVEHKKESKINVALDSVSTSENIATSIDEGHESVKQENFTLLISKLQTLLNGNQAKQEQITNTLKEQYQYLDELNTKIEHYKHINKEQDFNQTLAIEPTKEQIYGDKNAPMHLSLGGQNSNINYANNINTSISANMNMDNVERNVLFDPHNLALRQDADIYIFPDAGITYLNSLMQFLISKQVKVVYFNPCFKYKDEDIILLPFEMRVKPSKYTFTLTLDKRPLWNFLKQELGKRGFNL